MTRALGLKYMIFFSLFTTLPLNAKVYTPRVTTELLSDYTELGRFVNWHKWRGLQPQEKAAVLWKFLINYETGLFPIPFTTST